MERSLQVTSLVTTGLSCLQNLVTQYVLDGVFIKVSIGSEGMGPEITILLHGSRYVETAPDIEIQLWLPPTDAIQGVLIYSAFNPISQEIDHQSVDLKHMAEAQPYFDRAVQIFNCKRL